MIDDARLEVVLADLGALLVTPPEPAITLPEPAEPRALGGRGRRWVLAGVAATGILTTTVAPLRGAVADWLGIGSTQIEVRPDIDSVPAELPGIDTGARPISIRDAESALGTSLFEHLDDSALGAPAGFASIPEGGALVVWEDGTTLWVHGSRFAVSGWLEKLVASEQQVLRVDGLGDDALAVSGDHILDTPSRTLRAPTTVLWTRGDVELRLAGEHPVEDLVGIARELDAGAGG